MTTTTAALDALRADRQALLDICATLDPADWKAESGCPGWSVQDIVAHVGALFWVVVDPTQLPDVSGLPTEEGQEVLVKARRSWSAEQVVDDYRTVSSSALDALAGLATQDFELPVGDLGTYHASQIPSAFAFDHFTHIRADLFAPRGPLTGSPPPVDEPRLTAAMDWMEAALPQQNRDTASALQGSVDLVIEGLAARTITIGTGPVIASVRSDAPAFVRWATQRGRWEELGVEATGDAGALAAVRSLRVI
jgi:uncharacterized protein (TIGR03083 family)